MGFYVDLHLKSLMACNGSVCVFECVCRRGRMLSRRKDINKVLSQQTENPRRIDDIICTDGQTLFSLSPSTHMIIFCWSVCERKTSSSERGAKLWRSPVLITGTTEAGSTVSGSPGRLAATFPGHTHTQLCFTLVGAVCYPSGSVPFCLSACPPHKPNNATLLRLLRPWPVAQWKKRRTWRGGRGKWGRERRSHTLIQRLMQWNQSLDLRTYCDTVRHNKHICAWRVLIYLQSVSKIFEAALYKSHLNVYIVDVSKTTNTGQITSFCEQLMSERHWCPIPSFTVLNNI